MKKIAYLLVCFGFAGVQAHAILILYEPFNYSNFGAPVTENTPANWTTNAGGNRMMPPS